ncbi:MAG: hypothetical protein R3E82_02430 [Pseudomonadales bacterium]|nr:hypothetical protein [Pseudomonadales bacterium]
MPDHRQPDHRRPDHEEPHYRQLHQQQGLIDILEIYHARQARDQILKNLRRLHCTDPRDPFSDPIRRRETRGYYEGMLLMLGELLHELGDTQPLI